MVRAKILEISQGERVKLRGGRRICETGRF